ncbi:type VII secretion integral membrane protein EccD, partial [Solicola sp. PLA-1-18]|uniref:type VII secretion integral membrane protein EccD n=1 Tax=Solicola sp. PLA-1-18 TaxID=3380532 RepID=UPI003B76931B
MLTTYSRVTVVASERKVDLALPSALPVADVMAQVLRFCAVDETGGDRQSWTLARLGGQSLGLGQTLADAGVVDGDVLELRGRSADVRPALVEDVRDVVEDDADAAGGGWTSASTVTFAVASSALTLLVLGLAVLLDRSLLDLDDASLVVTVVVGLAGLLGLTAWGAAFARPWTSQLAAAVAMGWAYLAGDAVGDVLGLDPRVTILVAGVAVVLTAGAARLLTPAAMGHLAAGVVLLVTAVAVGVIELSSVDVEQVYRVVPVAALLATGVVPRLSLSVGGLASADYRVRHSGQMTHAALSRRYRDSNAVLVGTLVGISLVTAAACVPLTFSTQNPWDRYLALSVGVALLLRSRVYSRVQHMLPLRVAALAVLGLQVVRVAADLPELRPWLVPAAVGVLALAVGTSTLGMSD